MFYVLALLILFLGSPRSGRCRQTFFRRSTFQLSPSSGSTPVSARPHLQRIRDEHRRQHDWRSVSAVTVGGAEKSISPSRLRITRPVRASSAARRERTRKLTSRLASSSLPPKYPPIAPAPTTRTRISLSDGLVEIRRRNLFEDGAKLDRRVLTECAFEAALRCSPARTGFGDSSLSCRCQRDDTAAPILLGHVERDEAALLEWAQKMPQRRAIHDQKPCEILDRSTL